MSQSVSPPDKTSDLMPSAEQRAKLRRLRNIKDSLSRWGITAAGLAVVGSLGLIFFYLISEVTPLLRGASVEVTKTYPLPAAQSNNPTEFISLERYEEIGTAYGKRGSVEFFRAEDGSAISSAIVPAVDGAEFTAVGHSQAIHGLVAYGDNQGNVVVVKANYELSYPNDKRTITP